MSQLTKLSKIVLILLVIISNIRGISMTEHVQDVNIQTVNERLQDFSDCESRNPEFSYVHGRPNISAVSGSAGLTSLLISWDVTQVVYAPACADAFEVEFQQVGGGRLSWSEWSAMVGCAPTKSTNQVKFSCKRSLTSQHCSTRIRFRVTPHNSRSSSRVKDKIIISYFLEAI